MWFPMYILVWRNKLAHDLCRHNRYVVLSHFALQGAQKISPCVCAHYFKNPNTDVLRVATFWWHIRLPGFRTLNPNIWDSRLVSEQNERWENPTTFHSHRQSTCINIILSWEDYIPHPGSHTMIACQCLGNNPGVALISIFLSAQPARASDNKIEGSSDPPP